MTQGLYSTIVIVSSLLLSLSTWAADSVQWLARNTNNQSCYESNYEAIKDAVEDAQRVGLRVQKAQVGYLKNNFTCMACGCPEGTFYFVQVEKKEGIDNLIVGLEFKKVDEKDVIFK